MTGQDSAAGGMEMTYGDEFKDKVALVAGGTGALGRQVTTAFLGVGARVVVTYWLREEFDALLAAIGTADAARLSGLAADVTDAAADVALVEKMVAERGRWTSWSTRCAGTPWQNVGKRLATTSA